MFDVADLVKDAIVLPWAFVCAKEETTEQEFRQQLLQKFTDHNVLGFMFNQVKQITLHATQSPLLVEEVKGEGNAGTDGN